MLQIVIKPIKGNSITEINDIYKFLLFQTNEWTFAWIHNRIRVRVIASSVVYRGFKPKTLWLAFAASPLSMHH
jgi:hypothetical protein